MFHVSSTDPAGQGSGSQSGKEALLSELSPAVHLHLLRSFVQVKQGWPGQHSLDPQLEMSSLTEEIFWTTSSPDPRACLLEALGNFIVQVTSVLSQVSTSLINGPHIGDYIENYIRTVSAEDDLADTSVVSFLDQKYLLLDQISIELSALSNSMEGSWSNRPHHHLDWNLPLHKSKDRSSAAASFRDYSDMSTENDGSSTQNSPEAPSNLQARGKGKHVCPYGSKCERGGVNDDDTLVVFERNSAFRSHMAKHQKSFRCNIPGCPNTTGFARQDQLERHQKNVKHRPPS